MGFHNIIKHIGKLKIVLEKIGDKMDIYFYNDYNKMDLESVEYI
jgi:hypothetical protein